MQIELKRVYFILRCLQRIMCTQENAKYNHFRCFFFVLPTFTANLSEIWENCCEREGTKTEARAREIIYIESLRELDV